MTNKNYDTVKSYTSKTDDRFIVDVAAPGYAPTDITVAKKLVNDGKDAIISVKGRYTRPRGRTDKLVPRFAFDKVVTESFKLEFPFDKAEYNYDAVAYDMKNGVLRISVPKTEAARGEKIEAIAPDANINAVGLDDEADDN